MASNPSEIITLILEDYVKTPKGLTNLFKASGLMKYWFPVSSMPKNGENWPLVKHMIAKNQRLVVFTSDRTKQQSEGIAYQWKYMVENQCEDMISNSLCFIMNLKPLLYNLIRKKLYPLPFFGESLRICYKVQAKYQKMGFQMPEETLVN